MIQAQKLKVITTADKEAPGYHKLKSSLDLFGYDHELIIAHHEFGYQYKVLQNYCNNYKGDATHFLYTDAYDTLTLSDQHEVMEKFTSLNCKMLISAEKNCFPNFEDAHLYPETGTPWKYVNGGGCMFEIDFFKELCKNNPLDYDPIWLMKMYFKYEEIKLDSDCQIFQTIAFSHQHEWELGTDKRLVNIGTQTKPIFFHGNGRTDMNWIYKILE
jgi:hemin uptake protein HemP